ncbi:MAG: hypothetical protein KC680_00070 [Candidatus Peregrinibacteria bacterium]|nr:hypothetical protein [Candidatus Peregrinibacteria bacterium]MCB9808094.1 hypothetical protein [Candidatus Peribacteria bacterium]
MNSTQTTQTTQNSGKSTSPFDQIKELERREKERVDKELSALQKEKEDAVQSIAKKEEQSAEEMKLKAKQELKAYSENELTSIVTQGNTEALEECETLEAGFKGKKAAAVDMLVAKAKDAESLFPTKQ